MRPYNSWPFALVVGIASAFRDTSPFFLLSTSELLTNTPFDITSARSLSDAITPKLQSCPSDTYIIVSQPGVDARDYGDKRASPLLRKMVIGDDERIRSSVSAREVLGRVDGESLGKILRQDCEAGLLRVDASTGSFPVSDDMKPRVIHLDFPALPEGRGRALKLAENDAFLGSVIDLLPTMKYTIIYTTSPINSRPTSFTDPESETYQMETIFQSPVHMELKRDFSAGKRASDANTTLPKGPLFERYQFLSPGLFMGLSVTAILLSILYVGVTGLASLQVSYASFDKDMGPAAQKKQG